MSTKNRNTINSIPHGRWATIIDVAGAGTSSVRLMEMGFVPGARVAVMRTAPLGDPLQIRLRDYYIAIRRADAESIGVLLSSEA